MIVLYITYVNSDEIFSGSGVRPAKMLNAFKQEGHEVIVLQGEQVSKERLSNIKKIRKQIKRKRPDLCYIESPTYPIMRHADRKLIKDICKAGIPTGYFYRDFYWQFPKEFPRRTSISGKIKDKVLLFLQSLTNKVLKYCNIIYVPSDECKTLLKYHDIRALPPAGENKLDLHIRDNNQTGIYVGGITGHYDGKFLLDVFNELNACDPEYKLILVCRENEWNEFNHSCKNASWLEVHHTSGAGLVDLYRRASIAFNVGNPKYEYSQFAISVKIFEYLSYGLPQVVINNKAITNVVNDEKIGIAVEPDIKKFAIAIKKLSEDSSLYKTYQNNIKESLLYRNLWIHRIQQVIRDLTES